MPAIIWPTARELEDYFGGSKKHKLYEESNKLYKQMTIHVNKEFPDLLIKERRPSESTEVHAYRNKIYKSKTNNPPQKVLNSLGKIRRSKDWMIKFPPVKDSSITENENLEQYCTENYPLYDSVEQWAFSELLKAQGTDANAYVAVLPLTFEVIETDYFKPTAIIYNSDLVLYPPDKGDYCILKSTDKVDLKDAEGKVIGFNEGDVFYLINTGFIVRYEQIDYSRNFRQLEYKNPFDEIPVFKIKAVCKSQKDNSNIQVTRLDPMIESLDEAAREYSDLQGVKVQHANPLFWYIQDANCDVCSGTGKTTIYEPVILPTGQEMYGTPLTRPCTVECKKCGGTGRLKFSPYVSLAIKPAGVGQQNIPTPPAGYIQRDVDVMKYLDSSVKNHLYDSLASINMQFLDQTPLSISGDAKNVDREELNNFVYSFAEDIIWSLEKVIYWLNEWRYYVRVPDKNKRKEMLPEIPTPENFDLLPSEYLIDEIAKAKTSKLNPVLVAALEQDFAAKKFYNKPEVAKALQCVYDLNPLPGLTDDEKMIRLANKGITQEDYVISSNIEMFVKRAINEDKQFLKKSWSDQVKLMKVYAKEKVKENTAKELIMQAVKPTEDQQQKEGEQSAA
jgi:hypothetical protein